MTNLKVPLLLFITFTFFFSSCREEKPIIIEETRKESGLVAEESEFCFPIIIDLDDIEERINAKIKHTLVDNDEMENNVFTTVERNGKISISGRGGKMLTTLPVKITATKGDRIKLATIDFEVEFNILSDVNINGDWGLDSKSEVSSIDWKKNPELNILGFSIDLKDLVEKKLNEKRDSIALKVDEAIQEKVDIKKHLDRIWYNMQKPHNLIKKTEDSIFLFINPKSIYLLDKTIERNKLEARIKVVSGMSIKSSYKEEEDKRIDLPRLKKSNENCKEFVVTALGIIKFNDINESLNIYSSRMKKDIQGYNIEVVEALIKPSGQNLFINLEIGGDLKGKINAMINVIIDSTDRKLSVELVNFKVVEGDIELEIAEFIFGDFITSKFETFSGFNFGEHLKDLPIYISKGIENGKSGDNWHPTFDIMTTILNDVIITENAINVKLSSSGKGEIHIDKLKMKK